MFHSPEKNLQHNDSADSFHNLYNSTSKFHNKTATIDTLNTTSSNDHALKYQIEKKKDKLKGDVTVISPNIKSLTKRAIKSKTQNYTPIKKLKTKHHSLGIINKTEMCEFDFQCISSTSSSSLANSNDANKKQTHLKNNQNLDLESEIANPPTKITNFLQTSKIPFLNISDNNQGIEIPEDTQNNSAAPNIQTLSGIEKWLIHIKKNQVVRNQKLDIILENQELIKVHIHSVKRDEISFGNDFLELYQKLIPIKCKQDLIEVENLLTNESTFKVNLGKRMFGYSGEDVGRFMRQVLDSMFSAQFSTKISYTGKCHNKTTPNSKKVALSLLKIYNLITETCHKKFPNCSNELIRKQSDSWLRHCTQRLNQQKQRLLEVNELESIQLPHDDEENII